LKTLAIFLIGFAVYACGSNEPQTDKSVSRSTSSQERSNTVDVAAKAPEPEATPARAAVEPSNVREFFELLPEKYFVLEGCDREKDKDCKMAREEYLKILPSTVDLKNGYLEGGCDGAQACITMAIFKRPNGTYLIGVATTNEMGSDFHFLDYVGGQWRDASNEVPEFSTKTWYELPRVGTTMPVFERKVTEKGSDYEVTERGRKLYDLAWKDGKFTRK
jgi:hypothetical protein